MMQSDWIGSLPQGWNHVPFGSIFTQSKRKNERLERDFVLSVMKDRGVIPYLEKGNVGNKVSDDLSKYKLVDKGDFVLNSMNLYIGSVGVSEYEGVTSTAYIVCKPCLNIFSGFYKYVIHSRGFQEYVGLLGKGIMEIREAVRWTALKSVHVPLPDLKTQESIAKFLDYETARIDQLIEKKKRLVELLEEKRTTQITKMLSSVTTGVPVAAFRRFITSMCDGPFGSALKSSHYVESGVRVIRLQNIGSDEFINNNSAFIDAEYYKSLGDHDAIAGDLLVAGLGDERRPVGRACVLSAGIGPAMVKADCFRVRLDARRMLPAFAAKYLSSSHGSTSIARLSKGVTRSRINLGLLRRVPFPVLDVEKQKVVCHEIDNGKARHSDLVKRISRSVEHLQEYRSALIVAAVTGQVDITTLIKSGDTDRRFEVIEQEMAS